MKIALYYYHMFRRHLHHLQAALARNLDLIRIQHITEVNTYYFTALLQLVSTINTS